VWNCPPVSPNHLTAAENLIAAAENITGANLISAVLDALAAGKDYHGDKTVQRLLLDHTLNSLNISNAARVRASDSLVNVIVDSADDILESWADVLDPHADALAAAVDVLPTDSPDDLEAIKAAGPEAMHAWAEVQYALTRWAAAVQGFQQIAMAARLTINDKLLIVTPAAASQVDTVRQAAAREGRQPDAWTLAKHRLPLRLATLTDYMERAAEAQAERGQQAADRHDAEQHSARRNVVSV
jgi:hypothetical protein